MSNFRRLLVGWDGSPDARSALRAAAYLADELDARVVVLTVLDRPAHTESVDDARHDTAGRRLGALARMDVDVKHLGASGRFSTEAIEADRPAEALAEYAREHGFDLLVVGRHGLDQAVHPRIGRVTEHEVRHSHCPVLVVADS